MSDWAIRLDATLWKMMAACWQGKLLIERGEFERMKAEDELLESAEVHGNAYGTPLKPVEKVLAQGRDMLFDVDWQGASQVRERLGDDVVSIFVLPPSHDELERRRAAASGASGGASAR